MPKSDYASIGQKLKHMLPIRRQVRIRTAQRAVGAPRTIAVTKRKDQAMLLVAKKECIHPAPSPTMEVLTPGISPLQ